MADQGINYSATSGYAATTNENIVEKPLSPVLNKKRYSKKSFLERNVSRKPYEREAEIYTNTFERCSQKPEKHIDKFASKPPEKKASSIPVPIKDGGSDNSKRSLLKNDKFDDTLLTPSAILDFKREVITRCMLPPYNTSKCTSFATASGKPISISDGTIKCKELFADILNINKKTESELFFKQMKRRLAMRHPQFTVPTNEEFRCGSGDISDDSVDFDFANLKERPHYINGEDKREKRNSNLNMLFENKQFEIAPTSKTTIYGSFEESESVEILEKHKCQMDNCECCSNNCNTSECGAHTSRVEDIRDKFSLLSKNIDEEMGDSFDENTLHKNLNVSQLNYNVCTDESNSTLEQEVKELEKLFDQRFETRDSVKAKGHFIMGTRETNTYFSDISHYDERKTCNAVLESQSTLSDGKFKVSSKTSVDVQLTPSTADNITTITDKEAACGVTNSPKIQNQNNLRSKKERKKDCFCGFADEEIAKTGNNYELYNKMLLEYETRINQKTKRKTSNKRSKTADKVSNTPDNLKKQEHVLANNNVSPLPNPKKMKNKKATSTTEDKNACLGTDVNKNIPSSKTNALHTLQDNKYTSGDTNGSKEQNRIQSINKTVDNCQPEQHKLSNDVCEQSTNKKFVAIGDSAKTKKSPRRAKMIVNEVGSECTKVPENGPDPSTISLPANNRVQICIGNNRIQINIKPQNDFKQLGIESNLTPIEANSNQSSNKEIMLVTDSCRVIEQDDEIRDGAILEEVPLLPTCGGSNEGFKLASGKSVFISDHCLQHAEKFFDEPANVSERKILKPKTLLKPRPEFGRPSYLQRGSRKSLQFTDSISKSPSDSDLDSKDRYIQFGKMESFNFDFKTNSGFSFASGKNVARLSKEKLERALNLYTDIEENVYTPVKDGAVFNIGKKTNDTIGDRKQADEKTNEKSNNPGDSIIEPKYLNKSAPELIQDVVSSYDCALEKFNCNVSCEKNEIALKSTRSKKRLGMTRCQPVVIPKGKMEKAEHLFDDIQVKSNSVPSARFTIYNCTPVKINPVSKQDNTFTPTNTNNFSTSTPKPKTCEAANYKDTPIKVRAHENGEGIVHIRSDNVIVFQEKSCSDFKQLQHEINREYINLKRKLDVLEERKIVLEHQKNLIDNGTEMHRRPKLGILTSNKNNSNRVFLKNLFNSDDDNVDYFNVPPHIFEVSPKNSEKVHFNLGSTNEYISIVKTSDGATVIPNSMNMVGITEISTAFQAMESVDPKLLPRSWIQNHYRLIVWKLASYERRFPQYFKDCLSIENIVQQLKFRYDMEIDRVKRPALRKILERDDISQKRIILCVSDIIQVFNNKFELELTDGWYLIKATIDAPLTQQLYTNKIKIGTKLIINGAELLNCDNGCHPLDISENVRLKIGYNSTRRALWHTSLGYYKIPTPFPIHLRTLHPDGGPVGLLKIFIARVYPLRYVETHNNMKIWRNQKAEEKRAGEFEAEKMKQIESLKYKAICEYENENGQAESSVTRNILTNDLTKITCPGILLSLIQNSKDPEALINMLTPSQQMSVVDYKQNGTLYKRNEITAKINNEIDELRMNRRAVIPVLKLLVMDAIDQNDRPYVLNYWKPSEEHLHMLKEGSTFCVYNLMVKKGRELQSSNRTFFKPNSELVNNVKVQRQLLPIAMTVDSYYKPLFNEFDTVGLIVQTVLNDFDQELWLSDFVGRILFVRIIEGPKICSLLDNLKRGQTIALSNLILNHVQYDFGIAMANQVTVVSQYPSQKYLQQGLELFNQQLPRDVPELLVDCDNRVERIKSEIDFKSSRHCKNKSFKQVPHINDLLDEDRLEDSCTIPAGLTMTDVAMSLIDTDQFK